MHFKFLNIPVYIHPTFWIFLIFFTNIHQDPSFLNVIVGAIMFGSLLIHEYGHAATAMYFGASSRITLEAFGGKAEYHGLRITPKQEFIITLNGPLFQACLTALAYYLFYADIFENYYIRYTLYVTMRLNFLLILLNLIPVAPLDGGHLVRNLLERKFGFAGYRMSVLIGIASAAIGAIFLYMNGYFFFGTLLVIFGFQNVQAFQQIRNAGEENPFDRYNRAVEKIRENDTEKAKLILKKLLKTKDGLIKKLSVESLAKLYFQQGDEQKAYELLLKADQSALKEGKCLLCKLAFQRQNYELVAKHSLEIYALEPTYETALLNSKAFAHLNQPALATGWLKTASLFGPEYKNQAKLDIENPCYDSVRQQVSTIFDA